MRRIQSYRFLINSFLSCLCVLSGIHLFAQPTDTIPNDRLQAYNNRIYQEKIFVHTDKDQYIAGEISWLKLYVVDAKSNLLSDLSKVAYVEVIGYDGRALLQGKIALDAGKGSGSFQLPVTLKTGYYTLRAYTTWMRNSGTSSFFEKRITIINTQKSTSRAKPLTDSIESGFYPEGGNLIAGFNNRIGFRVVNKNGLGLNVVGVIVDQRNDTLVRFGTYRFGIGNFDFTPVSGNQYKAFFRMPGGTWIESQLPLIQETGYAWRCEDLVGARVIRLSTNRVSGKLFLFIRSGKRVRQPIITTIQNGKADIQIPDSLLGDGVSVLTLLDEEYKPVGERLVFKRPTTSMELSVKLETNMFERRSKVNFSIQDENHASKSVQSNLSMAVYRLDSLQEYPSSDIRSYLWLESELHGRVEAATWYMNNNGDSVRQALDNLMLVHGWRTFKQPSLNFLPEYEGHYILGKVFDRRTSKTAANIGVHLSVPGVKPLYSFAHSDSSGMVRFVLKDFYGGNELITHVDKDSSGYYWVDIIEPFVFDSTHGTYSDLFPDKRQLNLLEEYHVATQLMNSYYGVALKQFLYPSKMDTTSFYGLPDRRYFLDDYTRFQTMEEVMREFVANVRVRKNQNGEIQFFVENKPYASFFDLPPLVLIDGVPVFDLSKIWQMNPLKIKQIDVVARRYYLNNLMNDGIVSYQTYEGDLAGYELDKGALITAYEGLQLQRSFFSPRYEIGQATSTLPDPRNVLYWQPDITHNSNQTMNGVFYTSDRPGKYLIVIQGVDELGQPRVVMHTFSVK